MAEMLLDKKKMNAVLFTGVKNLSTENGREGLNHSLSLAR